MHSINRPETFQPQVVIDSETSSIASKNLANIGYSNPYVDFESIYDIVVKMIATPDSNSPYIPPVSHTSIKFVDRSELRYKKGYGLFYAKVNGTTHIENIDNSTIHTNIHLAVTDGKGKLAAQEDRLDKTLIHELQHSNDMQHC